MGESKGQRNARTEATRRASPPVPKPGQKSYGPSTTVNQQGLQPVKKTQFKPGHGNGYGA